MHFIEFLDKAMAEFSNFMWGTPLVVLLVGGGVYFTAFSKFIPFRYFGHAVNILRGKYDEINDPGQINHFQALSSALASTVGMGNIGGVALAIHTGGPGALFWMWVSAIIGMATKFFTCTLSIMYRGKDDAGEIQGGPMYVIQEGLGKKYKPLAILFSIAGLFGCFVLFQANQLAQIVRDEIYIPNELFLNSPDLGNLITGICTAFIVSLVVFGGIRRIGKVAAKLVPFMVLIYLAAACLILVKHFSEIPVVFMSIINDAFTGDAVLGGSLGMIISIGIKRAAFSNEAGIGTEAMAHGAAKTKEPVREGLVATLGPFIDTIVVCSITAFVILISGVEASEVNGVTLTTMAFANELGFLGKILLMTAVFTFSLTTMFGYSYYGRKCTSYLFGTRYKNAYNWFYIIAIVVASVISIDIAINFVDGFFALMAVPTMISTLLLSPKVMQAAKKYFATLEQ